MLGWFPGTYADFLLTISWTICSRVFPSVTIPNARAVSMSIWSPDFCGAAMGIFWGIDVAMPCTSFDAWSNSLLALPIALAMSGIFCGPQRKITITMMPIIIHCIGSPMAISLRIPESARALKGVLDSQILGLYLTKTASTQTVTQTVSQTSSEAMSESTTGAMEATPIAFQLMPAAGQMFHSGWVLVGQTDSGRYALSVHAEGLETASAGDYIVEGQQSSGSMLVVPLGANATSSEFGGGSNGVGNFFIVLNVNPLSAYESIQILYLPEMQMADATLVASAHLSMG